MTSGVTITEMCQTAFEQIKRQKKYRYIVFYIRDERQIDVETIGKRGCDYQQFMEDMQKPGPNECRFGLYDYEYVHQCQGTSQGTLKQKLFLMSWCPDTANIKKKMIYSSSFNKLKNSLIGVQKFIQATDLSEASLEVIDKKLRATDRS